MFARLRVRELDVTWVIAALLVLVLLVLGNIDANLVRILRELRRK
jgi:hypothetical protein